MGKLSERMAWAIENCVDSWRELEEEAIKKGIDRLAYYEDLEEQGRIVILPCETDAIVWYKSGNNLAVSRFDGQCVLDNDGCLYYKLNGEDVFGEEIGKTVFLSREEAEKALRGE